MLPSTWKEFN
jgi:hypothetical protein